MKNKILIFGRGFIGERLQLEFKCPVTQKKIFTFKDALKETEMVVEGVATTQSAHDLAKKYNIDMPITGEIYKVLYEKKDPKRGVHDLMTRSPKEEGFY